MRLHPLSLLLPLLATQAGVFRVRFVSEETHECLAGVRVLRAQGWTGPLDARSDPTGWVSLARRGQDESSTPIDPRQRQTPLHGDEVVVQAESHAGIVIDSVSTAPWASEVPLRGIGTLTGFVTGARKGEDVSVVIPAQAVTWPPRTGLERTDPRQRGAIDDEGRYFVVGIPANTPVSVWLGAGTYGGGLLLESDLVLAAGERRERSYDRPPDPEKFGSSADERYRGVSASASEADGRPVVDAWFEIVPGGRYRPHRVGGGRWHVHGNRPCDHLEALPGRRVVVARNSAGLIGVASVDIPEEGSGPRVRVGVAPGSLVRIHAAEIHKASWVRLTQGDLVFGVVRLVPGEIRYELIPAGEVSIALDREGSDPVVRKVEAKPGETVRIDL